MIINQRFSNLFLFAACAFGASLLLTSCATSRMHETNPPSAPFIQMLETAKNDDMEGFFNCFSERDTFGHNSNPNDFKEAQTNLRSMYGDLDPSEFEFQFEGKDSHGVLVIIFKGEENLRIRVVKEGTEWKLDEH
jgi:hypothetical protein